MADVFQLEIDGIGKFEAPNFQVNPFKKTITVTKVMDGASNTIARWHQSAVLDGGGTSAETHNATLTQLDSKRMYEISVVDFKELLPLTISLVADPGKKAGVQKTLERLVVTYESLKIRKAPAAMAAQLTGG